jgi:hypothetical protein
MLPVTSLCWRLECERELTLEDVLVKRPADWVFGWNFNMFQMKKKSIFDSTKRVDNQDSEAGLASKTKIFVPKI